MAVKVRTRQVNAMVGQDVVTALGAPTSLRAHADQREVRRAATNVGHQHQALLLHGVLEVQGGGDGLVLELHFRESRLAGCGFQCSTGLCVAFGLVVDKKHRAPQHRTGDGVARLGFSAGLEVAQIPHHHVAVLHTTTATNVGALVQQTGAQDAFHGPHEAAVHAFDVGGHGRPAIETLRLELLRWCVGPVKHRGGHGGVPGLQLDQSHAAVSARQRNSGVGGSKVNGYKAAGLVHVVAQVAQVARSGPQKGRDCIGGATGGALL